MIYQNREPQHMPRKRRLTAHRGDMSEVMMMMWKKVRQQKGDDQTLRRHTFGDFPGSFRGRSQKSRGIRSTCERGQWTRYAHREMVSRVYVWTRTTRRKSEYLPQHDES
jgi:hypothetical protein